MSENNISMAAVQAAVANFKNSLVAEPLRPKIKITPIYRIRAGAEGSADWPKPYGTIWGQDAGTGVYLHFDAEDYLIYVGKAVSIGGRLGNYFEYAEDRSCKIKDETLKHSCGVRAIVLDDEPLRFLAPSLEWYLIDTLNPAVNKQHKRHEGRLPT